MKPPDAEKVSAWIRFGQALVSPLQRLADKIRDARAKRRARRAQRRKKD